MSHCFYHPETRAKFVCPDCGQDVCDQCRLDGGLQRCGHCAEHGPPAGGPAPRPATPSLEPGSGAGQDFVSVPVEPFPAGGQDFVSVPVEPFPAGGQDFVSVPVEPFPPGEAYDAFPPPEQTDDGAGAGGYLEAHVAAAPSESYAAASASGFDDFLAGVAAPGPGESGSEPLVMCSYHGNVVADIQCLNCFQPFCMACLPAGTMCAACKADPQGRAVRDEGPAVAVSDLGYEPGMDFAASYVDSGGIHEAAAAWEGDAGPRPRKPGGAKKAGAKKGMGPKKAPAKGKGAVDLRANLPLVAGGLAIAGIVAGAAWYFLAGPGSVTAKPPAFKGPTKVAVIAPKGPVVRGLTLIRLKVDSPQQIDHLDLFLGKKKFYTFKRPPFSTDWPTNGSPNGKVELRVTAYYKHGVKSTASRVYKIRN